MQEDFWFKFHFDWLADIDDYSGEEVKELLTAAIFLARDGIERAPTLPGLRRLWPLVRRDIRMDIRYRETGAKGGHEKKRRAVKRAENAGTEKILPPYTENDRGAGERKKEEPDDTEKRQRIEAEPGEGASERSEFDRMKARQSARKAALDVTGQRNDSRIEDLLDEVGAGAVLEAVAILRKSDDSKRNVRYLIDYAHLVARKRGEAGGN